MKRAATIVVLVLLSWLGAAWPFSVASAYPLAPTIEQALERNKQIIIASTRKNGKLSEPSEVWFLYLQRRILVASQTSSWRVRRIKAKRPQAKIWVGDVDGPSFMATGKLVNDPKLRQVLLDKYAEKYASAWPAWKDNFTVGLKSGTRVLIEYTPDAPSAAKKKR